MSSKTEFTAAQNDLMRAAKSQLPILEFLQNTLALDPRQAMLSLAISYIAVSEIVGLDQENALKLMKSLFDLSHSADALETKH